MAALQGRAEVLTCLMNWGASLTARDNDDELPIDAAADEAIKQLIRDEEICRRDHGYKRAVIPNPTPAEQASIERARLEAMGETEGEGQGQGQGQASASAVAGDEGQGQASAGAVAEEDDDDDSGSDEEHEVAYLKSLKRQRTK